MNKKRIIGDSFHILKYYALSKKNSFVSLLYRSIRTTKEKKRIKCDKEEKPKKQKSKNLAKLRGQKNLN